jgi:hypothetical protein
MFLLSQADNPLKDCLENKNDLLPLNEFFSLSSNKTKKRAILNLPVMYPIYFPSFVELVPSLFSIRVRLI